MTLPPIATELLPPQLQEYVRLIGIHHTMVLVERFGGLRIFIPTPARCMAEHPIAQLIGLDNLLKLAKEFGGIEHRQLPKAQAALLAVRDAAIAADSDHKSIRALAIEHGLTERQIVRILAAQRADAPADRRQQQLFTAGLTTN